MTLDSGAVFHASIPGPMGSLSSSFIPAGRLRNSPTGAALKARRRTYEMA